MTVDFKHPLARKAKIWTGKSRDGTEQQYLLVVTTLELKANREAFRPKHVDRLTKAVEDFVAATPEIAGYMLVNRPKDWDA